MLPTVVEPLREQWANVQAAAVTLAKGGQLPEARKQVSDFLGTLCNTAAIPGRLSVTHPGSPILTVTG